MSSAPSVIGLLILLVPLFLLFRLGRLFGLSAMRSMLRKAPISLSILVTLICFIWGLSMIIMLLSSF